MRYAVALSGHPDAATAVGEVVGQVMDRLGPSPDVAMLFISPSHLERAADIAGTVLKTLAPGHLLGCSAGAVLAQRQEVEQAPGLVLWVGPVLGFVDCASPVERNYPGGRSLL